MPQATEYPDNPSEVDKLLDEGERKARADYVRAGWQYYRGEHRKPLKVKTGQPDPNVILNLTRKLVDTGAAMLFGLGVTFELVEGDHTPEEEYLESVWRVNRRSILMNDIAVNGGVAGHVVVKIVPPEKEGGFPRLINISPGIFHAFWREDDVETVLWYTLNWSEEARQDIVRRGDVWQILDYRKNRGRWELADEQVWPFAWAPIVDWKNLPNPNMYYGLSDLEDEGKLNDAINFLASNMNSILYHHAHPKTIGTGMRASDVQETAVGGFWTVPSPDAKVYNLEMQSDLASSMAFLDLLRSSFFSLGSQVDLSTMKDRLGQLTNFGLRVLFYDAINRLRLKRALYGEGLTEINRRVLDLAGKGPDHITTLHWPFPLPESELEMSQVIKTDLELGIVSKETASTKRGYDWQTEQERIEAERAGEETIGSLLLRSFERGQ